MKTGKPTLLSTLTNLRDRLNGRYSDGLATIYKKNLSALEKDFRKTKINKTDALKALVKDVLIAAQIDKKYWGRYTNAPITAYDFLDELRILNKKKNIKNKTLNRYIAEIDALESIKRDRILATGLILIAFLGQVSPLLVHDMPAILQAIHSASTLIPFLGAAYTLGVAAYSFYQTVNNTKMAFKEKFIENFFLLSSAALNLSAYTVAIAVSAMSPLAGALFVVGSVANLGLALARFYTKQCAMKSLGEITPTDTLETQQEKLRAKSEHTEKLQQLAINTVSAALMVGIMAVWCFVPGAALLSIAAIITVTIATNIAGKLNKTSVKNKLISQFEACEATEALKNTECQSVPQRQRSYDSTHALVRQLSVKQAVASINEGQSAVPYQPIIARPLTRAKLDRPDTRQCYDIEQSIA